MFIQNNLLSPKNIFNQSFYQTFLPFNKIIITIILYLSFTATAKDITDNTCTFKVKDKVFSLAYLNMKSNGTAAYYTVNLNDTAKIEFNFCQPFVPQQCKLANVSSSYSYLITQNIVNQSIVTSCHSFSSNSKTSNFNPLYIKTKGPSKLNLTLQTQPDNNTTQKSTIFILDCDDDIDQKLLNIRATQNTNYTLLITGKSPYACPLFQISSLWNALSDNQLIFGVLMLVVGFIMLFYGILMTHLMIFLAAYLLSFAALIGIFTAFLGPDSSRIAIYFSLLFIIFISTLVAYGLTRLVDVSIFCIGAFLGFILAAIVNTIFIKMFAVYSIWSIVFFSVVFMIPLGLLTFKYSQQIIILSTSLAGSYMVVRPFSWIFGGFPNQFTLYQSIQNGELSTIPWTVFFYLIMILGIFVVGVLYQLLKISQRQNDLQYVNYLPEGMENRLDQIHNHVEKLINKYSNNEDHKNQNYSKMNQGSVGSKTIQLKQPEYVAESLQPQFIKQSKSKQNNF